MVGSWHIKWNETLVQQDYVSIINVTSMKLLY